MRADPDFERYHETWTRSYDRINYEKSLSARVLRASHVICEARWSQRDEFSRVLEVGAGSGVHVDFVRHRFERYVMSDASTSMLEKARDKGLWRDRAGVELAQADACALQYADASFDRLIAAHVLEHLPQPHRVLREWARVVRPGGVLSLVLPCDPGFLWRLGRHLGPRATATEAGLEYDYWMAREHINPVNNLVTFLRYYFVGLEERWWPCRVPSMDLNLFYVAHVRV